MADTTATDEVLNFLEADVAPYRCCDLKETLHRKLNSVELRRDQVSESEEIASKRCAIVEQA
jgi:hypothetical protein